MCKRRGKCGPGLWPLVVLLGLGWFGLHGCGGHFHRVTVDGEESFELATDGIRQVLVMNENGAVRIRPRDDADRHIEVRAMIRASARAGGDDQRETPAKACLAAVEILTPVEGSIQKVYWKLRERQFSWQAGVTFEIAIPAAVELKVVTHNGAIDAEHILGDAELESHNGQITARDVSQGRIVVSSRNGELELSTAAREVNISTHNGDARVQLTSPDSLKGKIDTHNGSLEIHLARSLNCQLAGLTHNGRLHHELDAQNVTAQDRHRLRATLGAGGEQLAIESHNGTIDIELLDDDQDDEDHQQSD